MTDFRLILLDHTTYVYVNNGQNVVVHFQAVLFADNTAVFAKVDDNT